jgi:hypothetical protein
MNLTRLAPQPRILDCGGKRSATPLLDATSHTESGVAGARSCRIGLQMNTDGRARQPARDPLAIYRSSSESLHAAHPICFMPLACRVEPRRRPVTGHVGRSLTLPPFGVPPSGGVGASPHLPRKRGTPNASARRLWGQCQDAPGHASPENEAGRPAGFDVFK